MMLIMNDYDTEEQQLLNALNNNSTQYNQQYNFNFDNNINNHHRIASRVQQQFDYPEPTLSYEPYSLEEPDQVSIGSLSPEEFLENLNELNEDDMAPDANATTKNQKPSNKMSRRITFCESEDNNSGKEQPNHVDSKPTIHRSKSEVSVESNNKNDDPEGPVRVKKPTDADILCGQSRICANHTGNRYFQSVLDEFACRYESATSKQEKMCMTKQIVSRIHNNRGRFLKQKKDGMWEEISTVAARDKVSHALRTKAAGRKRNQDQEQRRGSVTPPHSRRSSLSRSSIRSHRRRSSNPEQSSTSSDFVPIPFEGDDANSEHVLSGLFQSQKEIFATMNSLLSGSNSHHGNYHHQQQTSSHRHSFPTYHDNSHYRMER